MMSRRDHRALKQTRHCWLLCSLANWSELLWSKQEGVGLAMNGAIPGNLTGVVDAIGLSQHPAASLWDQSIQVLHPAAIS